MLLAFIFLIIINKLNIKKFLPYLVIGLLLWDFTHNSGIHATIAGVLLAMTIPHRKKKRFFITNKNRTCYKSVRCFWNYAIICVCKRRRSLEGLSLSSLMEKVPLGIVLGLFVGKQLEYLYSL